ncbi:MAG: alpha/beta hydrolase [Spirochaetia bacterium]
MNKKLPLFTMLFCFAAFPLWAQGEGYFTLPINISLVGIAVFAVLLYFINASSLFYRETEQYNEPDLDKILAPEALPIEKLQGSDKAVFLIHGFPSTPAVWQHASELFHHAGYDVHAPLLPGCGTHPTDFLSTNFSQYYAFVKEKYLELRKRYEKIFIVGTSMGGALTLRLAEEFSGDYENAPTGIAAAAAPVFLNSIVKHGVLVSPALYVSRIVSWFVPSMNARIPKFKAPGEGVDGDERWRGYHGIYPRQLHSLKLGVKNIERNLPKITVPIYVAHSKGDKTVPFANLLHITEKVSSKLMRVRILDLRDYNHTRHSLFLYNSTRDLLTKDLISFFEEAGQSADQ